MSNRDVTVKALGPGNPHRPVLYRGKPITDCTREELIQGLTFLLGRPKQNESVGSEFGEVFAELKRRRAR